MLKRVHAGMYDVLAALIVVAAMDYRRKHLPCHCLSLFVCLCACLTVWNCAAEVLVRLLHMLILLIRIYRMFLHTYICTIHMHVGEFVGLLVLDNMLQTAGVCSSALSCNFYARRGSKY